MENAGMPPGHWGVPCGAGPGAIPAGGEEPGLVISPVTARLAGAGIPGCDASHRPKWVRQDLISTEADATSWGHRLAGVLAPILADPAQHRVEMHRSRTDTRHRAPYRGG